MSCKKYFPTFCGDPSASILRAKENSSDCFTPTICILFSSGMLVAFSQTTCCKFQGALKQYEHAVRISEFAFKLPSCLNVDKLVCVISGFRRGVNEISLFWHVTQRRLVVTYRRFVGTAVAQWLRCCATNRKVAGSIPDGGIGIFH